MKNYPNFKSLYDELASFVKEHQGEKGYIDCQPSKADEGYIITGFVYDDDFGFAIEQYVYGVRVKNNYLEVFLEPVASTYEVTCDDSDFTNEGNWKDILLSDVYYIPTLLNIAQCIESRV
jgi:hypothetical protein